MVDDFDVVLQNGGSAYRAWARLSMGCASTVAAMLPQKQPMAAAQQPTAAASLDTSTVVRPLPFDVPPSQSLKIQYRYTLTIYSILK